MKELLFVFLNILALVGVLAILARCGADTPAHDSRPYISPEEYEDVEEHNDNDPPVAASPSPVAHPGCGKSGKGKGHDHH